MQNPCTHGRTPDETICPHMARNKNHPDCVNCTPRLEYAVKQGMLHPEVLEQKKDPVIVEAREKGGRPRGSFKEKKTCSVKGCDYWAKIKGKCASHYGKAYRKAKKLKKEKVEMIVKKNKPECDEPGCHEPARARGKCQTHYRTLLRKHPELAGKYQKDPKRRRVQINLHFGNKNSEAAKVIGELEKIAKKEMRRTTQQALYFLRDGIERWKGESVR
ncbi:hypothetical protein ES703_102689 [subsurface metagenome]